jgi:hypothetical protein
VSYAVQLIIPEEKDKTTVIQLSTDEALQYMVAHNFCNQHQLVRDKRKIELRKDFFRRYFEQTNVYLVNTLERRRRHKRKLEPSSLRTIGLMHKKEIEHQNKLSSVA